MSIPLHYCNGFNIFSRYLVKNSSTLFSATDYEVAPPEYHRKAVWVCCRTRLLLKHDVPVSLATCNITMHTSLSGGLTDIFHLNWFTSPSQMSQELVTVQKKTSWNSLTARKKELFCLQVSTSSSLVGFFCAFHLIDICYCCMYVFISVSSAK